MIGPLAPGNLNAVAAIGFENYSRRDLQFFLNHACAFNLECRRDDEAQGFGLALLVQGALDIIAVSVSQGQRRLGLGKEIVSVWLASDTVHAASLEVAESNAPAIALYRSVGFEAVGRRRRYYGGVGDALVMAWARSCKSTPEFAGQSFYPDESLASGRHGKLCNDRLG